MTFPSARDRPCLTRDDSRSRYSNLILPFADDCASGVAITSLLGHEALASVQSLCADVGCNECMQLADRAAADDDAMPLI